MSEAFKQKILRSRLFFVTTPQPCPYLPGRLERRLITDLGGPDVAAFHDVLSQAGFRRSHGVAYVPVCWDCTACVPVRVKVAGLVANRSQRRIWRANRGMQAELLAPRGTREQYQLFRTYQLERHADGEMARMDFHDYRALIEETPVETLVLELRDDATRGLRAVCLVDCMADGLSAVYSFYDNSEPRRSLGTFIILWLIEHARQQRLPHVYLGYWVADSGKMAYKAGFRPLEAYTPDGWRLLDLDAANPS